jgi:hypothetical protein
MKFIYSLKGAGWISNRFNLRLRWRRKCYYIQGWICGTRWKLHDWGCADGDDDGWMTLVVRVFPIEESFLRLIFAILMMSSEKWECSRLYIRMESS